MIAQASLTRSVQLQPVQQAGWRDHLPLDAPACLNKCSNNKSASRSRLATWCLNHMQEMQLAQRRRHPELDLRPMAQQTQDGSTGRQAGQQHAA